MLTFEEVLQMLEEKRHLSSKDLPQDEEGKNILLPKTEIEVDEEGHKLGIKKLYMGARSYTNTDNIDILKAKIKDHMDKQKSIKVH